ncbi:hypothetical protein F5X99DRAFT_107942 [Biscogniauxia marginata]|nr:hypothetical protein F5X99DRAFT_107942 [Biscogniauxia marginata]
MSIVQMFKRLFRKLKERKLNSKPNPNPEPKLEPEPEPEPPCSTKKTLEATSSAVSEGNSQRTSPRNDQYEELSENITEPPTAVQQPVQDNSDQESRTPSLEPESGDNGESLSRDNGIRPDPNFATILYIYPRVSSGPFDYPTAFTARKCLQKTSYIIKSAANRLGLGEVEGAKHDISWLSWEGKLSCSIFVVVSDDFMNIEVALGTEWSVDESVGNQIVNVPNQQIHDRFPNRGKNLESSLLSLFPLIGVALLKSCRRCE